MSQTIEKEDLDFFITIHCQTPTVNTDTELTIESVRIFLINI